MTTHAIVCSLPSLYIWIIEGLCDSVKIHWISETLTDLRVLVAYWSSNGLNAGVGKCTMRVCVNLPGDIFETQTTLSIQIEPRYSWWNNVSNLSRFFVQAYDWRATENRCRENFMDFISRQAWLSGGCPIVVQLGTCSDLVLRTGDRSVLANAWGRHREALGRQATKYGDNLVRSEDTELARRAQLRRSVRRHVQDNNTWHSSTWHKLIEDSDTWLLRAHSIGNPCAIRCAHLVW